MQDIIHKNIPAPANRPVNAGPFQVREKSDRPSSGFHRKETETDKTDMTDMADKADKANMTDRLIWPIWLIRQI